MVENPEEKSEKTYQIFEAKGQWKVTIPRVLAQAVGLKKGDKITWSIYQGDLVLRKVK